MSVAAKSDPIRLARRLTTHHSTAKGNGRKNGARGEQWHPWRGRRPLLTAFVACQEDRHVDVFLYDGKCILRTFGCIYVLILTASPFLPSSPPSPFLFTFGLNIRGGAHLRTRRGGREGGLARTAISLCIWPAGSQPLLYVRGMPKMST